MVEKFISTIEPSDILKFKVVKPNKRSVKITECECTKSIHIVIFTSELVLRKPLIICCRKQFDALKKILPHNPKKFIIDGLINFRTEKAAILFDIFWAEVLFRDIREDYLTNLLQNTIQTNTLRLDELNHEILELCIATVHRNNIEKVIIDPIGVDALISYFTDDMESKIVSVVSYDSDVTFTVTNRHLEITRRDMPLILLEYEPEKFLLDKMATIINISNVASEDND